MMLSHKVLDDIDIANFSGRLTMDNANEARNQLKAIIESGKGRLLVDLGDLTFIDSSGCSVLISAYKSIRARQGTLVLSNLSAEIQSLIELTRLNEIFEIFADRGDALAELRKR